MARILVADDTKQMRLALRLALEHAGHQVDEATDGVEALVLCAANRPDLLICELFMPGRDGLETIREVRRSRLCSRIIALSGGTETVPPNFQRAAQAMGADMALAKPVHLKQVVEVVQQLLGIRNGREC